MARFPAARPPSGRMPQDGKGISFEAGNWLNGVMLESSHTGPPPEAPLCVDLDGTLIRTDLLWESSLQLLKRNPFALFQFLAWWPRGRACLKANIARRVRLDAARLPYHQNLLDYLREEKRTGRTLLLVTASDERLARVVADHVGLFDEVLASDGKRNLRGKNKAALLVEWFGAGGFDYAGNSRVDLPVWAQSRKAIVVSDSARLVARARKIASVARVFAG